MRVKEFIYITSGVILGILIHTLVDLIPLDSPEIVELSGILVNVILGIIIVILVQKKLSDERGIKDYFITEIGEIKTEYNKFINKILFNKNDPQFILEWFKTMSMRIQQLEYFLKDELKIKNLDNQSSNRRIHKILTNSEEFNESISKRKFEISVELNNELTNQYKDFKHSLVRTIVKINRA
ncbi:hypothetical protein [Ekhidna sp.]|uniref:hypothetical protein n=1 Tax=Ekhidna sp. TaxID=2608089 RepID=UPI0032987EBF